MAYRSILGRLLGYDGSRLILNGVPLGQEVRGKGRDFYVSSVSGDNGAAAATGSVNEPFTTVTLALAACTANRGDRVLLLPGHTETIGNETLAWAKAGVAIIGLGVGAKQARFHHNHASALITLGANDMKLQNIRFSADVTSVAVGIDILAGFDDCVIEDCRFDTVTGGTDEYTIGIQINAGCDRTVIRNNVFEMGIAATVHTVKLTGASDRPQIVKNQFWGDASTAHIGGITTLSTNILIDGNLIVQGSGGDIGTEPGIELLTGTHGIISNNNIVCNLATKAASIVADTCLLFENYYNEDITGTGGLIGTVSADD